MLRNHLEKCVPTLLRIVIMDLEYELNLAIEAAKDAGTFLLEQKNNEKLIISEAGRDIKLKLDQDTELLIRNKLKESKYAVFGEEYGGNLIANEKCWVVDPIDGTSNYFRNIDQCCVSIALLDNFQAKIGVIYNFNSDEMINFQALKLLIPILSYRKRLF